MSDAVMPDTADSAASPSAVGTVARSRPPGILRAAMRLWRTRIGFVFLVALLALAFLGRYVAPYGEQQGIGLPFRPAGKTRLHSTFGSAKLGHDVLTRLLYGGRPILIAAVLSTAIALILGTLVGLVAAYNRGRLDDLLMRTMDVVLSMPQIIIALVVLSMLGAKTWLIILAVGLSTVPRIARVVRGASVSIVERDFISAAEALGESRPRILFSEILPNIAAPLLVEANLRLTFAIGLIAGISFLGFTPDPGAANWGLMINENRGGLVTNHWGVTLPVLAVALLTVATGMIGDGISRAAAGLDRQQADS